MIEPKKKQRKLQVMLLAVALSCCPAAGLAQTEATEGNSVAEGVAVLKQLLQESRDRLKAYEWTETTVVHLKGKEKARRLSRCHYRVDGKIEREVTSIVTPQKKKRRHGRLHRASDHLGPLLCASRSGRDREDPQPGQGFSSRD